MSKYAAVSHQPKKSTVFVVALLSTALLLAVSKSDASSALKEALNQASPGQSQLDISGTVISQGQYTMDYADHVQGPFVDIFQPAPGGRGDKVRFGSNAHGPYMFKIYTDAVHQNNLNNVGAAHITITLPENATPGTYPITALDDVQDDQAYASMVGASNVWQFDRKVDGTVEIIEIGDALTAAWDFVAHDRRGNPVNVSGAVKDLALAPQPQVEYVLTVNGESEQHLRRLSINRQSTGAWDLLLNMGIDLRLPSGIQPGTYTIRKSPQSDHDITTTLTNYNFDDVMGELVLEGEGEVFSGHFTLTTSGKDVVELNGSFEQVVLPDS